MIDGQYKDLHAQKSNELQLFKRGTQEQAEQLRDNLIQVLEEMGYGQVNDFSDIDNDELQSLVKEFADYEDKLASYLQGKDGKRRGFEQQEKVLKKILSDLHRVTRQAQELSGQTDSQLGKELVSSISDPTANEHRDEVVSEAGLEIAAEDTVVDSVDAEPAVPKKQEWRAVVEAYTEEEVRVLADRYRSGNHNFFVRDDLEYKPLGLVLAELHQIIKQYKFSGDDFFKNNINPLTRRIAEINQQLKSYETKREAKVSLRNELPTVYNDLKNTISTALTEAIKTHQHKFDDFYNAIVDTLTKEGYDPVSISEILDTTVVPVFQKKGEFSPEEVVLANIRRQLNQVPTPVVSGEVDGPTVAAVNHAAVTIQKPLTRQERVKNPKILADWIDEREQAVPGAEDAPYAARNEAVAKQPTADNIDVSLVRQVTVDVAQKVDTPPENNNLPVAEAVVVEERLSENSEVSAEGLLQQCEELHKLVTEIEDLLHHDDVPDGTLIHIYLEHLATSSVRLEQIQDRIKDVRGSNTNDEDKNRQLAAYVKPLSEVEGNLNNLKTAVEQQFSLAVASPEVDALPQLVPPSTPETSAAVPDNLPVGTPDAYSKQFGAPGSDLNDILAATMPDGSAIAAQKQKFEAQFGEPGSDLRSVFEATMPAAITEDVVPPPAALTESWQRRTEAREVYKAVKEKYDAAIARHYATSNGAVDKKSADLVALEKEYQEARKNRFQTLQTSLQERGAFDATFKKTGNEKTVGHREHNEARLRIKAAEKLVIEVAENEVDLRRQTLLAAELERSKNPGKLMQFVRSSGEFLKRNKKTIRAIGFTAVVVPATLFATPLGAGAMALAGGGAAAGWLARLKFAAMAGAGAAGVAATGSTGLTAGLEKYRAAALVDAKERAKSDFSADSLEALERELVTRGQQFDWINRNKGKIRTYSTLAAGAAGGLVGGLSSADTIADVVEGARANVAAAIDSHYSAAELAAQQEIDGATDHIVTRSVPEAPEGAPAAEGAPPAEVESFTLSQAVTIALEDNIGQRAGGWVTLNDITLHGQADAVAVMQTEDFLSRRLPLMVKDIMAGEPSITAEQLGAAVSERLQRIFTDESIRMEIGNIEPLSAAQPDATVPAPEQAPEAAPAAEPAPEGEPTPEGPFEMTVSERITIPVENAQRVAVGAHQVRDITISSLTVSLDDLDQTARQQLEASMAELVQTILVEDPDLDRHQLAVELQRHLQQAFAGAPRWGDTPDLRIDVGSLTYEQYAAPGAVPAAEVPAPVEAPAAAPSPEAAAPTYEPVTVMRGDTASQIMLDAFKEQAPATLPEGMSGREFTQLLYRTFPEMTDAPNPTWRLSPAEWRELGLRSGDPNLIYPGEQIDINRLMEIVGETQAPQEAPLPSPRPAGLGAMPIDVLDGADPETVPIRTPAPAAEPLQAPEPAPRPDNLDVTPERQAVRPDAAAVMAERTLPRGVTPELAERAVARGDLLYTPENRASVIALFRTWPRFEAAVEQAAYQLEGIVLTDEGVLRDPLDQRMYGTPESTVPSAYSVLKNMTFKEFDDLSKLSLDETREAITPRDARGRYLYGLEEPLPFNVYSAWREQIDFIAKDLRPRPTTTIGDLFSRSVLQNQISNANLGMQQNLWRP